ncbi:uncharacterized protein LOC116346069 [Contarinia nasturtii]|uniref:uncharacterized protein LOC116346069 n=1 Tax=Contarinia nasturtii TaxID=265458 RepID=UPI0012D45D85|nr:uncharacterized protein LOC116346069 [Contarinia nasturtii]
MFALKMLSLLFVGFAVCTQIVTASVDGSCTCYGDVGDEVPISDSQTPLSLDPSKPLFTPPEIQQMDYHTPSTPSKIKSPNRKQPEPETKPSLVQDNIKLFEKLSKQTHSKDGGVKKNQKKSHTK